MNKTALITGASSGIGLELAKLFAKDSYNLVLVAREKSKLEEISTDLCKKYSVNITTISIDLTLPTAPEEIFDELRKKSIHIDILVNNAGTQIYGKFQQTNLQKELQLIQVNLVTLTHLTKLAVVEMLKHGGGKILNIGSTGSFAPAPLNAIYCATKAYVLSFSEGISKDLEGAGITVTTLCPGATKTEFSKKAQIENTRMFNTIVMNPSTVAKIGYKALFKGKRVVVAGLYNKLMVILIRFTPRWLVLKLGQLLMS
ncbi:SDR family oxidoreductase [Clostridium sp. DJ247]|uniref:SDR family NAD(P)-dependent oxidoreductase n=1 Tax=Clostridium sp. DJ247 TaxID=2726188 RepID=UPI001628FA46|nr:SDR family oxidoreductase [Clostridium sp. DJ247]MBC2579423.1 SDR family oxidoreductase [Clostridium sp. DJ247]